MQAESRCNGGAEVKELCHAEGSVCPENNLVLFALRYELVHHGCQAVVLSEPSGFCGCFATSKNWFKNKTNKFKK